MINTLRNNVYVVLFFTFLHHTYALWKTAPEVPPDYIKKSCSGWLEHHGFKAGEDNALENRINALTRERQFDPDVSLWAALYASYLTAFTEYSPVGLRHFCFRHSKYDNDTESYYTIKGILKTCINWIRLYGYNSDDPETSWDLISKRWQLEDKHMAIFPALYAQYIEIDESRASTTREEFCHGMGFTNNRKTLEFVSMFDTLKTCKEWLVFAGYNDNLQHNLDKVEKQTEDYERHMNEFVQEYSEELRQLQLNIATMGSFMINLGQINHAIDFMTPGIFCDRLGERGAEKRHYKPFHLQ